MEFLGFTLFGGLKDGPLLIVAGVVFIVGLLLTIKGGDNTITLAEMATYLKNRGNREALNTTDGIKYMHPQVYPSNSSFPLFMER